MAEKLEAENASWERTGKDLFAGAAGGIAQVLLGKVFFAVSAADLKISSFCFLRPFCWEMYLIYLMGVN